MPRNAEKRERFLFQNPEASRNEMQVQTLLSAEPVKNFAKEKDE
ncbi:hypothetical protein [Hydrobacter penzbergensis]|nr:hypothetical protein [Hydrobacter penzbergensis]